MKKDWFLPHRLAQRLGEGAVSNREVMQLMLANLLAISAIFYSGVTTANLPWTWLSFYECVVVVFISVFGLRRCYAAAGGDGNPRFATDFNCLTFPIWLWSSVGVWSLYWLGNKLMMEGFIWAATNDLQFSRNLADIGGDFLSLWLFLAAVGLQALYFGWMSHALGTVAKVRAARPGT